MLIKTNHSLRNFLEYQNIKLIKEKKMKNKITLGIILMILGTLAMISSVLFFSNNELYKMVLFFGGLGLWVLSLIVGYLDILNY